MQKYNNRNEVPEEYKWDLTPFFKDEQEWNETYTKTEKLVEKLKEYPGCTKNAHTLYEFLTKEMEAIALWEDLYVYAYLVNDQELGVSESIARKNKAEQLSAKITANISFFAPELLSLSEEEYKKLFMEEPLLKEWAVDLEQTYRKKAHILNAEEEQIVSKLVSAMDHFEDMSSTMINKEHDYGKIKLENGEVVTIATNNFSLLMKNKNPNIRKKVYNLFNKKIMQYKDSNAMYLNSYINMNDTTAQIRHYKDSWDRKLFEYNLSDNVFKTLVKTTESHLNSIQRYYQLKKDVLGLPTLNRYDLYMELVDTKKEYSIKEAQQIVKEAIKPLGEDYCTKFDKIIKNRYIDYCQYKGKCSGGYSFSTILQDSRILMSFNNNLVSISTIAHEGGHNVHHQYVSENNPYQYRGVTSIVSEVASLTNECLLSSYLANNGRTRTEKLAGIENILDVIASNLYGAVREGKMEQEMYEEVHKGGTLTKEFLDKLASTSLKKYYGNVVKCDKYASNTWVTRSHYFMHFYLYSYAICISVAASIASKILKGDKKTLDNYIAFLKVGSDKWPSEAFKILGVDLEDKNVYENAISYFDSLIDKYYEIYNSKEEEYGK